ncbi:MAG: xyloglucanase [Deltaproteobacteria bacterium]|nr:xyloglucanase [Deltaproteobacteria bacterium]
MWLIARPFFCSVVLGLVGFAISCNGEENGASGGTSGSPEWGTSGISTSGGTGGPVSGISGVSGYSGGGGGFGADSDSGLAPGDDAGSAGSDSASEQSGGSTASGGSSGQIDGDLPQVEQGEWKNVAIIGGGFIPGIVFNSGKAGLVYARTDIGGAYRFDPPSQSWVPLLDWVGFEEWNLSGVESIAADPVEPNRVYIAAGTYTNEWTSMNGAILRSSDYGQTFERTDLSFKLGGNMPGRSMGERLAVDPNDNRVIYFGARSGNGLWKSVDFGATWSKVSGFPATGTWADAYFQDPIGVVWVTFDPKSGTSGNGSETIYVGVAETTTPIYQSTDGGATWAAVAGQPSGYLPHHGVLSSTGVLYVTYSDDAGPYDGQKGEVWKYDSAQATWTDISPIPSSSEDNYFGYGGVSMDAQNPETVMVTALSSWWPDTHIFRSLDGGASWTRIWEWTGYPSRSFRYEMDISAAPWLDFAANPQPPEVTPKLGWMVGDIEIDPFDSNRMLYGTGATLYGTDNLGDWDTGGTITISVKAQGIEETSVLDLVSPPSGAQLISGLGDICGFRHDDVTQVPARMMIQPTFVTTTSIDYAESTPEFVVRVGNLSSSSTEKNLGISRDGGNNWYAASNQPTLTGGGVVALASDGSRIVWSPAGGAVHYSPDGNSWTPSSGITAEARVASDRVNPKKFYGYAAGVFYLSTDGGASFSASAAGGLPAEKAYFKAVPGVEGDIWLAGGSKDAAYGLWHSTDSGASFTKLSNVQEADVIGFGKAAAGKDYVALYTSAKIDGVRAIFRSDDAGVSWTRITDDQHQFASTNTAITGDPRVYGRVYVGTNGRGIVYRDQ